MAQQTPAQIAANEKRRAFALSQKRGPGGKFLTGSEKAQKTVVHKSKIVKPIELEEKPDPEIDNRRKEEHVIVPNESAPKKDSLIEKLKWLFS